MNVDPDDEAGTARAGHLLKNLSKLLESGQVTADEAAALRGRIAAGDLDEAVRVIRTRHAEVAMASAVSGGSLTQAEADDYLRRIRAGEHSPALRADVRGLRRQARQDDR